MENIKISGAGTVVGGEYDEISISGSGKIKGRTKCNTLKSSGSICCDETLEVNVLKTSGSAKFEGDLKVNEGKTSGSLLVEGTLEANKFEASGGVVVKGDVNVDEFSAKISKGTFENIYGDKICINSVGTFVVDLPVVVIEGKKEVKVENIEATTICIKDVKVDRVSGDVVCIEEGCVVNVVEYRKSLDISSKAKIEMIIKL